MRTFIVCLSLVIAVGCGSTSEAPNAHSASAAGGAAPASGGTQALAGTWTGRLTGQHDTAEDVTLKFSASGHLMYEYAVRDGGTRSVEWVSAGQKIEFLPPGGGVQRITIEAIENAANRVTITQKWVFEQSGNFLTQNFLTSQVECTLTADGLKVTIANVAERFMNGNPTGTESETYVGVLKKQ